MGVASRRRGTNTRRALRKTHEGGGVKKGRKEGDECKVRAGRGVRTCVYGRRCGKDMSKGLELRICGGVTERVR